jgi:hypothetical protein
VQAAGSRTAKLALPSALRRALKRKRTLALRLTAVVRDPSGGTRKVRRSARVRLTAGA